MATYNGEKYIRDQINSILDQLDVNDELIISDDKSSDNTCSIVLSFHDKRIILVTNENEKGISGNFENALSLARGDYIFLSDQDDIWLKDKVSDTIQLLKEYDFIVSDCVTIDANGAVLSVSRFADFRIKTGFLRLMIRNRYLGCCMAFNRKVLLSSLPFPSNSYLIEHDLWIASIAECYFKTSLLNKSLIEYRRHMNNASSGGFDKGYSIFVKGIRRIYRLICLVKIYNKVKKISCSNREIIRII
jgi:glycosyltransferase involved in cell wall biosynthesis